FRCNVDGSELETLAWNFRNNWELCVDSFGNMWQSDNDDDGNRGTRINFVMEFGNYGYRDELTGDGWQVPRTGMEAEIPLRHWHLNDPGVVPNILQTGAGSPTGICFYEGTLLPKQFRNQIIHTDPGPNVVRAYPVEQVGAGYTASISNMVQGVNDPWFRPVDVCAAPDGSLFVADWYDPGVGGHAMGDPKHGRIFRIVPSGHKGYQFPKADFSTAKSATESLMNPNLATRFLAQRALQSMGKSATAALEEASTSAPNDSLRARALWQLAIVSGDPQQQVQTALADADANLRIVGIRMAREHGLDVLPIVERLIRDPSAAVRRELAIALRHNAH
ncbi:MAG: dehydrogenase, partial [Planctomycetales bacterium]|nr:dehydrogenase [Planctomycetales bacterium]